MLINSNVYSLAEFKIKLHGAVHKAIKLIMSFCIINNFIRIFIARLVVGVYSLPHMYHIIRSFMIALFFNMAKAMDDKLI